MMYQQVVRSFLLLLLLLGTSMQASAQPIRLGMEGSLGYSSLPYDNPLDEWDTSGQVSYGAMAFALIPISASIDIQPGLRFHTVGNNVDVEGTINTPDGPMPISGTFSITQTYLSIPVRMRYALQKLPVYFIAGPELGYLVSADLSQETNGAAQEESIIDTVNRFNVVLTAGAGITTQVNDRNLFIQVFYSRGINGVADDESWGSDWHTQEIGVGLGIIL